MDIIVYVCVINLEGWTLKRNKKWLNLNVLPSLSGYNNMEETGIRILY